MPGGDVCGAFTSFGWGDSVAVAQSTQPAAILLPDDIGPDGAVGLLAYQRAVQATDKLPSNELSTAMLGLFGEVGGLLAVVKKRRRDAAAYPGYSSAILEEVGDVLWYFTALVNRAGLDLSVLGQRVFRGLPGLGRSRQR